MTSTIRAAVLARVSSRAQVRHGLSLEDQIARCIAATKAKGWSFDADRHLFVDRGVSGKSMDRPAWRAFMAAVEDCQVDALVVSSLDRLGRTTVGALDALTMLADRGIEVVSLRESIDISTAMGKFTVTLLAGIAELERGLITERTQAGIQVVKDRGRWLGAPPYGWRLRNGSPVAVAEHHDVIRLVYRLAVQDRKSVLAISNELNRRGIRPPRSGAWTNKHVSRAFTNKALSGTYTFGDYTYQLPDPPLTPSELAELEAAFEARTLREARRPAHVFPLSGRTVGDWVCDVLGEPSYVGKTRQTPHGRCYRIYLCRGKTSRPGRAPCSCPVIDAPDLEARVWGEVIAAAQDERVICQSIDELVATAGSSARRAVARHGGVVERIARLGELVAHYEREFGESGSQTVLPRLDAAIRERDTLASERDRLEREIAGSRVDPELIRDAGSVAAAWSAHVADLLDRFDDDAAELGRDPQLARRDLFRRMDLRVVIRNTTRGGQGRSTRTQAGVIDVTLDLAPLVYHHGKPVTTNLNHRRPVAKTPDRREDDSTKDTNGDAFQTSPCR